jgi:hypothetical protein
MARWTEISPSSQGANGRNNMDGGYISSPAIGGTTDNEIDVSYSFLVGQLRQTLPKRGSDRKNAEKETM